MKRKGRNPNLSRSFTTSIRGESNGVEGGVGTREGYRLTRVRQCGRGDMIMTGDPIRGVMGIGVAMAIRGGTGRVVKLPRDGKDKVPRDGKDKLPRDGKNKVPRDGKDKLRVTGSNFNKYLVACESVELIDRTHKQLKRITFVKQQVYSVCNQGKYPI